MKLVKWCVLLGCCSVAQAGEVEPHWYLGADIGQGYYSNGGNSEAYDSERHRLAGGVHFGYQFNSYFSTELAYQYLGKPRANYSVGNITGEFQQGVLSASIGYPLFSNTLTPYFKVGGAAWWGDVDELGVSKEADGFSPVFGGGVSYLLNDNLSLRLEYQFTDSIGDKSTLYADHHLVTIGMSWRFGHRARTPEIVEVPVVTQQIVEKEVEKIVEVPVVKQETFVFNGNTTGALFANNSSQLVALEVLQPVVNTLLEYPYTSVNIIGHTDNVGAAKYNLWLSEKRAQSVANHLIAQGIAKDRITLQGKGMTSPITSNETAEGRAMNRRVEIQIQGHNLQPLQE